MRELLGNSCLFKFSHGADYPDLLLPVGPTAPGMPLPNNVVALVVLGRVPCLFLAFVRPTFSVSVLLRTVVSIFTKLGSSGAALAPGTPESLEILGG